MAKIDELLSKMLEAQGTTMHIGCNRPPMYRKNEMLSEFGEGELSRETVSQMLKEICPRERWDKFMESNDMDFIYTMDSSARFRCNYYFDRSGIGGVFHSIPAQVPSLDDIEAPQVYKDICHLPGGFILTCGPLGSGTTTTQAAMLQYINENTSRYIISISTLIEYTHQPNRSVIEQCEVEKSKVADTLAAALNSNPDVIVIDDLPDARSVRLALRAAMMGILVIASLPTSNFAKTLDYISDMFPVKDRAEAKTLLAESVQAILSQMLCHSVEGGRAICREVLLRAEGVPTAIRENNIAALRQIMDSYRQHGMRTLDFSLRELLATGKITASEAYARATDKRQFQHFLVGY